MSSIVRTMVPLVMLVSTATLATSATRLSEPAFFTSSDLKARLVRVENGLDAALLPVGHGMHVHVAHRDLGGEVEMHATVEHFYLVQSGEADVLLGASVVENREISAGEWRSGKILGGKHYRMKAGDVLWIPARTAHQVLVPKNGSFQYIAVSADAKDAR